MKDEEGGGPLDSIISIENVNQMTMCIMLRVVISDHHGRIFIFRHWFRAETYLYVR